MTRWLALFLANVAVVLIAFGMCQGQNGVIDVQIPTSVNPFFVVASSTPWANSAGGSNYVLSTPNPNVGICVAVQNNNPTNTHAATLNFLVSNNFAAVGPFANSGVGWFTANGSTTSADTLQTAGSVGSTFNYFMPPQGAPKVAIQFFGASAAGTPDTFTITATSSNFCPGVGGASFGQGSSTRSVGTPPDGTFGTKPSAVCDNTSTITVATGTTSLLVNAATNIGGFHICAVSVSGPVTTGSANFSIAQGSTATSCAGASAVWTWTLGASSVPNYFAGGSSGAFLHLLNGRALCAIDGATTSSVTVSLSFAYY